MSSADWTAATWVIGWTLLHFVWQGILLAAVLGFVRLLIPQRLAHIRYAAGCITLAAMLVAPLLTAVQMAGMWTSPSTPPVAAADTALIRSGNAAVDARAATSLPATGQLMPILVVAWGAGVLVCTIRLAGGWWVARRLVLAGTRPAPASLVEASRAMARRIGLARAVRVLVSTRTRVPLVVGWLRPVLLVPAAVVSGLPVHQLEAVLAHELAHVRRHDYLVNLLQSAVETLLFYHPAVWWVSHTIRVEREHCCDDLAAAACGDRVLYARALAAVESFRQDGAALALAANGGSLVTRIRRLLGEVPPRHVSTSHWVVAALTALMVSGAGATSVLDDFRGSWLSLAFAPQPVMAAPSVDPTPAAVVQSSPQPAPAPAPAPAPDASDRKVEPRPAPRSSASRDRGDQDSPSAEEIEAARREAMARVKEAIEEARRAAKAAMEESRRAIEEAHRARADAMEQYRRALEEARRALAEAHARLRSEYASRPEIRELVRQTQQIAREARVKAREIAREAERAARRAAVEAQREAMKARRERRRPSDGPGLAPAPPVPPAPAVAPAPAADPAPVVPPASPVPPAPEPGAQTPAVPPPPDNSPSAVFPPPPPAVPLASPAPVPPAQPIPVPPVVIPETPAAAPPPPVIAPGQAAAPVVQPAAVSPAPVPELPETAPLPVPPIG